jgi:hypothetical protein
MTISGHSGGIPRGHAVDFLDAIGGYARSKQIPTKITCHAAPDRRSLQSTPTRDVLLSRDGADARGAA